MKWSRLSCNECLMVRNEGQFSGHAFVFVTFQHRQATPTKHVLMTSDFMELNWAEYCIIYHKIQSVQIHEWTPVFIRDYPKHLVHNRFVDKGSQWAICNGSVVIECYSKQLISRKM